MQRTHITLIRPGAQDQEKKPSSFGFGPLGRAHFSAREGKGKARREKLVNGKGVHCRKLQKGVAEKSKNWMPFLFPLVPFFSRRFPIQPSPMGHEICAHNRIKGEREPDQCLQNLSGVNVFFPRFISSRSTMSLLFPLGCSLLLLPSLGQPLM